MTRLLLSAVLVLAGSSLAGPAFAADISTSLHSGVIVSIDTTTHRLKLQEMGPWKSAATKPVTRSIDFGRDTKFDPGDFATVTVEHDRKGPEAVMVQVVRPVGTTG